MANDTESIIQRINEELATMQGSAISKDGSVNVTTDAAGRIVDLWIADWAMEVHGAARLADIIIDRHRVAMFQVIDRASRTFDSKGIGSRE
ncbi:YbaB/EbfC family nucleoid-associated protein [Nocardia caishijiensis]|uniref:YbaB/EbfC DNA-binding family protein n=1 Tax=Nocardia caishijiensis TaxID=184756 RepID=A0ABQ6YGT7_9NOCA|nr:YbaB/EbfC family nucleoid-associated protein [Nocardia caishijiensis]KAF0845005.1 YbaB/EbfC DNA-binding family protein [Nocardia caishijiensis]